MYEVKIINNGNETIINTVSTSPQAPRITGQCKFGINTIDSFTFTILPNNQGYDLLKDLKTLVEIKNIKTNEIKFKGRILIQTPKMDSSGLLTKSITCESELGYLMDSVQEFEECHNITVRGFLELIIDNHNKQVSEDKRFTVGIVDVIDNNDSLYRFLGYDKTLDTIKDKLIDRLGGELRIRYEDGVRYLDYIQSIGEKKDTEIVLARNLVTIEQERDPSDIITRLIPLGAKLEDSDERLTISSINNGLNYIDDEEAISKFGIIVDTVTYDDVTIVENLLRKGKEYLKENNKIKKKHKVTALDLSTIGLDVDSFEVGNIYRVVNPLMNIYEDLRVIEKTLDINSPQSSSLSIGDKFEDIKDYQLSIEKTSVKAGSEANEARAKANYVETYATDEIYRLDSRINKVTVEVGFEFDNLANVAKTGKYSDLLDKPVKLSQFENDLGISGGNGSDTEKLSKVAYTGQYSDLLNKPTKLSEFKNDIGFGIGNGGGSSIVIENTLDNYNGATLNDKMVSMFNDINNNYKNTPMLITLPQGVIEITENLCAIGWTNKILRFECILHFKGCNAIEFKQCQHNDIYIHRGSSEIPSSSNPQGFISLNSVNTLTKRGFKFSDCNYNYIKINTVLGFTNAIEWYSEYGALGCCYNILDFVAIWRCKQAMKFYTGKASDDTSSQSGWVTEIFINNGMFDCLDGIVIGQDLEDRPKNEPTDNYQGLKFTNIGVEHVRLKENGFGFNFKQGKNNSIINPRFEGSLGSGNNSSGAYKLVKESIYAWNNKVETSNYPINIDRVILNHSAKQANGTSDCICGSYITGDLRDNNDGRVGEKMIATPGKLMFEVHNMPDWYFNTYAKPNTVNYKFTGTEFAKVKDERGNIKIISYI